MTVRDLHLLYVKPSRSTRLVTKRNQYCVVHAFSVRQQISVAAYYSVSIDYALRGSIA